MKPRLLLLTVPGILAMSGCLPWGVPQRPAMLLAVVEDPVAFQTDAPAESAPTGLAEMVGCWGSVQRDGPVTTSLALSVGSDGQAELAWDIVLAGVVRGVVVQRGTLAADGEGRVLLSVEEVETDGPGGPAVVDPSSPAPLPLQVRIGQGLLGVQFLNEGGPEAAVGRTLWFVRGGCLVP